MDALLLAVLNALWQGAALIALAALALRAGLRRSATTACVVWSVAFGVIALLPLIDLALAHPWVAAEPSARAEPSGRIAVPAATRAAPALQLVDVSNAAARVAEPPAAPAHGPTLPQRVRDIALALGGAATVFARAWGIVVLGAWAVVAGALVLRLARGYAAIARMKREATPLDDPAVMARLRAAGHRRRADVACSPKVGIPCAVGFRRPMILLPASLAASLDADDLARVILHESAHLQRYDDVTNALEQIVCALQFFQPALYVARRGIDFEREVACDDRVLEAAGEPLRYAECLARIVQRHVRGRQAVVVPGFVLRRAQVVARVRRIVDGSRGASPHLRVATCALAATLCAATLGLARLQVPVVAPALAAPIVADCICPAVVPRAARPAPAPHAVHAVHAVRAAHAAHAVRPAHAVPVPPAAHAAHAAPPAPAVHLAAVRASAPAPQAAVRVKLETAPVPLPARAGHLPAARAPLAPLPPTALIVPPSTVSDEDLARVSAALAEATAQNVPPVATTVVTSTAVTGRLVAARAALESAHAVYVVAPHAVRVVAFARDGGSDVLEAIDEAKYPHPSVDELIALREQGISGDYIRRMGALGRDRPSLRQLLALAMQGVSPEYVRTLDRRLAAPPSIDDIVVLHIQGVSATWLDGLALAGYRRLTPAEAASLSVQGVSVAYVRGLLNAGLRNLTPPQLAALRVQGIDGPFVQHLARRGYHNLSLDDLVRLKASGFEP
jgi:beta-lactamase regulating signal transducer with metallopeptidase domain